ncbi:MAG: helix-turn-helix transcriptional regulator [Ktedonobacteraceae bacterium]|nr:helix-turn-helix transcriptional regulator [Ktedonobacteraceae bacterium]
MPEKTQKKLNIIGDRVSEGRLRIKPHLTQADLAARLQVLGLHYMDQAKISRIEHGTRPVYDYEILPFAQALGVSVNWLLSGQDSGY